MRINAAKLWIGGAAALALVCAAIAARSGIVALAPDEKPPTISVAPLPLSAGLGSAVQNDG